MSCICDLIYYSMRKIFSYNWRPKFINHWMPRNVQLLNFPEKRRNIIYFSFRQADLIIKFIKEDLIHIWWKTQDQQINVFGREAEIEVYDLTIEMKQYKKEYLWRISTRGLAINVSMNGEISLYNKKNHLVLNMHPPKFGLEGFIQNFSEINYVNGLGIQPNNTVVYQAKTYHLHNEMPRYPLTNRHQETSWNVPMYITHNNKGSCLIYHSNSYSSELNLSQYPFCHKFAGGSPRYYLSTGNLNKLIENYNLITGFPKSPPEWAFNNHLFINDQQKFDNQVKNVIINQPINNFSIDLSDLSNNVTVRLTPEISKIETNPIYLAGLENDHFLEIVAPFKTGGAVFPDIAKTEAQKWYAQLANQIVESGVKSIWLDRNEPFAYAFLMDRTLPYDTIYNHDGVNRTHREIHNLYGYLISRAFAKYQSGLEWIISTSGWAGSQKYSTCMINPIQNTWTGLTFIIPITINLGLSGCPFFVLPSFKTKDTILLIRFLQIAIFTILALNFTK